MLARKFDPERMNVMAQISTAMADHLKTVLNREGDIK
jgi:hypothetical protein